MKTSRRATHNRAEYSQEWKLQLVLNVILSIHGLIVPHQPEATLWCREAQGQTMDLRCVRMPTPNAVKDKTPADLGTFGASDDDIRDPITTSWCGSWIAPRSRTYPKLL